MSYKSLLTKLGIGSSIIALSLFVTACPSKITEEQMKQLDELRKEERSLNDDIKKKNLEASKLEAELKARKNEVKKCQEDTEFVKMKLSQWPNVWPDWTPEVPGEEEPEETK